MRWAYTMWRAKYNGETALLIIEYKIDNSFITWGMTLPTSWSSIVGIGGRKGRTDMGVEAKQMFQCLG